MAFTGGQVLGSHMHKLDNRSGSDRKVPPLYERAIPLARSVIAATFVELLVIFMAAVIGVIPGVGSSSG